MAPAVTSLTRTGYDLDAALILADAADLAYQTNPAIIKTWCRSHGFDSASNFDHSNIQGFQTCNREQSVTLLAFRGTSNPGQWLRDARLAPAGHFWGTVHRGFLTGLEAVEADLVQFDALARESKHVWITGHSLGGALAVLAAARLWRAGIASTMTYTFGQPRVGFGDFAQLFDEALTGRLYRFINQHDIVPRLPPGLLYRHCGTPKRIVRPGVLQALGSDDQTTPELQETELPPASQDEADTFEDELNQAGCNSVDGESTAQLEGLFSPLADHSMREYIRLLTEIREAGY